MSLIRQYGYVVFELLQPVLVDWAYFPFRGVALSTTAFNAPDPLLIPLIPHPLQPLFEANFTELMAVYDAYAQDGRPGALVGAYLDRTMAVRDVLFLLDDCQLYTDEFTPTEVGNLLTLPSCLPTPHHPTPPLPPLPCYNRFTPHCSLLFPTARGTLAPRWSTCLTTRTQG